MLTLSSNLLRRTSKVAVLVSLVMLPALASYAWAQIPNLEEVENAEGGDWFPASMQVVGGDAVGVVDLPQGYRFVAFIVGLRNPGSDAIWVSVKTPNDVILGPLHVEPDECHYPDSCDWQKTPGEYGMDGLVLEYAPAGQYEFQVTFVDGQTWPSHRLWDLEISAEGWQIRAQREGLLMNKVFWYQPDGTSHFVEDAGYILWDWTPVLAFMIIALAWSGIVIFLIADWTRRYRRLQHARGQR